MTDHDCVFIEEREPSGRLIVGPCLVCGRSAMDGLEKLKKIDTAVDSKIPGARRSGESGADVILRILRDYMP